MGIDLGIGMSHAPFLFLPTEIWPMVHGRLAKTVPQPEALAAEDAAVLAEHAERVDAAFAQLADTLAAYRPDAVIVVGDDQREVFDSSASPSLAVYVGEQVSGTLNIAIADQDIGENHLTVPCAAGLAADLTRGLIERGFDPAILREIRAAGRPAGGLGHAFMRACAALRIAQLGVPIIPVFVEAYHPPMPSAARCLALGHAMREIFAGRPERIAVVGSGGLSHDPGGPRAGWIDEPLDRWILDGIRRADLDALSHLFTFDSATLSGGTGEVRSWLVAAAAMDGVGAEIVDYVPIYHALTGAGFAVWPSRAAERAAVVA